MASFRFDRSVAQIRVAAAVVGVPFLLLTLGLRLWNPPSFLQLTVHADPLVRWIESFLGTWGVPLLGALILVGWLGAGLPERSELRQGLKEAALGMIVAAAAPLLLRLIVGPHLPGFIPPEESDKPGLTLGIAAGFVEEALFRLGTLPLLYLGLKKKWGGRNAAVAAAVATGLLFALSHELYDGLFDWSGFDAGHFAARTIVPGIGMSALFFLVSPSFIVALHCTAHLFIPYLFS